MSRYNLLALMMLATICVAYAQTFNPPPQNCSANESYSQCGKRCEPTCTNQNPRNTFWCWGFFPCFPIFTQSGCRCKPNFVRNNGGICIPPANCTTS